MTLILCVDGDQYLNDLLRYALTREEYEVLQAATGQQALELLRTKDVDLVTLDLDVPDMNGLEILTTLRSFSEAPVVVVTGRSREEDIIAGFEHGADDYMSKPFNVQVLVTRIKAILRRHQFRVIAGAGDEHPRADESTYRIHGAIFEPAANEITGASARVRLTPTQSRILQLLFQNEGQIISAECIMERALRHDNESDLGVIRTHIRHLREKISRLPHSPQPIDTVPGVGYVAHQIEDDGTVLVAAEAAG